MKVTRETRANACTANDTRNCFAVNILHNKLLKIHYNLKPSYKKSTRADIFIHVIGMDNKQTTNRKEFIHVG